MDMDILIFIEFAVYSERVGAGADIGHRRMGALLHNVAQRARELELARAVEHCGLTLEQLTADGGPRKSVDYAYLIGIPETLLFKLRVAEQRQKVALLDAYLLLALGYALGGLAAD